VHTAEAVEAWLNANLLIRQTPHACMVYCLQDEYRDAPGSVVASDFYHANTLLPLSDDEIVRRVHSNIAACEPGFADAKVQDMKLSYRRSRVRALLTLCRATGRSNHMVSIYGDWST
jgi:hypothetical protein